MAKVGIVTIVDGCNYGNRLQNYALSKTLTDMGFRVVTIQRRSSRDLSAIRLVMSFAKHLIKCFLGKPHKLFYYRRRVVFRLFNRKYIPFSDEILAYNKHPNGINDRYEFFVVGSDQVWNANFDFIKEDLSNYLLAFASREKRVAYAASFGSSSIPSDFKAEYEKELSWFASISVREDAGVKLVEEFTGSRPELVADPTLLLSKRDWESIMKKPKYINENVKFVLTYIMSNRTTLLDQHIRRIANRYSADVVNLDIEYIDSRKVTNLNHFLTGPSEFLWLIKHAECVITDSFHASVFSLIFHKPLLLYKRQGLDMSNRLKTLLDSVGVDCIFDDYDNPALVPMSYDYDNVDSNIRIIQAQSYKWLARNLGKI